MNQSIDLKTKNSTELKAIAYDMSRVLNNLQNQLVQVNEEIAIREQQEQQGAQQKHPPDLEEVKEKVALKNGTTTR